MHVTDEHNSPVADLSILKTTAVDLNPFDFTTPQCPQQYYNLDPIIYVELGMTKKMYIRYKITK